MGLIRVCSVDACGVRLSRWNPGERCWEHTPGAGVIEGASHRILAQRKPAWGPEPRSAPASEAFRFGVAEGLSPGERTAYWTGRWTGEEAS